MRIETHDRLGSPESRPATRLVVYDDFGNPVAVFIQVDARNIFLRTRDHPEFAAALYNLGVRDTTVVTTVKARELPPVLVQT